MQQDFQYNICMADFSMTETGETDKGTAMCGRALAGCACRNGGSGAEYHFSVRNRDLRNEPRSTDEDSDGA